MQFIFKYVRLVEMINHQQSIIAGLPVIAIYYIIISYYTYEPSREINLNLTNIFTFTIFGKRSYPEVLWGLHQKHIRMVEQISQCL